MKSCKIVKCEFKFTNWLEAFSSQKRLSWYVPWKTSAFLNVQPFCPDRQYHSYNIVRPPAWFDCVLCVPCDGHVRHLWGSTEVYAMFDSAAFLGVPLLPILVNHGADSSWVWSRKCRLWILRHFCHTCLELYLPFATSLWSMKFPPPRQHRVWDAVSLSLRLSNTSQSGS